MLELEQFGISSPFEAEWHPQHYTLFPKAIKWVGGDSGSCPHSLEHPSYQSACTAGTMRSWLSGLRNVGLSWHLPGSMLLRAQEGQLHTPRST